MTWCSLSSIPTENSCTASSVLVLFMQRTTTKQTARAICYVSPFNQRTNAKQTARAIRYLVPFKQRIKQTDRVTRYVSPLIREPPPNKQPELVPFKQRTNIKQTARAKPSLRGPYFTHASLKFCSFLVAG